MFSLNNTDRFCVVVFIVAMSVFVSAANSGWQGEAAFVDSDGALHHTAVRQYDERSPVEILSYLYREEQGAPGDRTTSGTVLSYGAPFVETGFDWTDASGTILLTTVLAAVVAASMYAVAIRTGVVNDTGMYGYGNQSILHFGRFLCVPSLRSRVSGVFMVLFFVLVLFSHFLSESHAILDSTITIDAADISALQTDDNFGTSVANVGDLDRNGVDDFAIGAPGYDVGREFNVGAVHILFMGADGNILRTAVINATTQNGPVLSGGDNFGSSVAGIGDLNGDGVVDIAVGALGNDGMRTASGAVYILFMSETGGVIDVAKIDDSTNNIPAVSSARNFGSSIAEIGDLNGDGVVDIAVGALRDLGAGPGAGAVYILFMDEDGGVVDATKIDNTINNDPVQQFGNNFGTSVAHIGDLDGDGVADIVVGAFEHDIDTGTGSIHILFMNTNGSIKYTTTIDAETQNSPVLSDGDNFGSSVANVGDLDGNGIDDIIVGAMGDDNVASNAGAVHILFMNMNGDIDRSVTIDGRTQNIPTLSNVDSFGSSIANTGDLNGDGIDDILVGAQGDRTAHILYLDILQTNGNASVDSTTMIGDIPENDPLLSPTDNFGRSVAGIGDLDGDEIDDIAVGATGDAAAAGAVHILFMNEIGNVKRTAVINDGMGNGPVLSDGDFFGSSIAGIGDLDGDGTDDLAVGAFGDNDAGTNAGAIYILFMDADGSAKRTAKINDSLAGDLDLLVGDLFGSSVANVGDLDGDGTVDLAVGAPGDNGAATNAGAIHILFMNVNGTVKSTVKINDNPENNLTLTSNASFGESVANIGDLDGDGTDDLVVGAPRGDGNVSGTGTVYILFMNTGGGVREIVKINDSLEDVLTLSTADNFGSAVAGIDDLNNDGINDIAVGAPVDGGIVAGTGAVHILFMNTNGSVKGAATINDRPENDLTLSPGDSFGSSVASIGNLDGTGIGDIAVGAPGNDGALGDMDVGAIHIIYLDISQTNGNGVVGTAEISSSPENNLTLLNADIFGFSVAGIGDLNGDGIDDLAVGAPGDDGNVANTGAVYILFMDADGSIDDITIIDDSIDNGPVLSGDTFFGSSVANIGDLNGDGTDDIAIGESRANGRQTSTGAVHILFMNADGSINNTAIINDNTNNGPILSPGSSFGRSVAGIGDLDGDGIDDVAVGAIEDTGSGIDPGTVHILFMNADGSVRRTVEISDTTQNVPNLSRDDDFGTSIANIGDLDGDGIADIAVGAPRDSNVSSEAGTVYILFMNENGGVERTSKIDGTTENGPMLSENDFFGASVANIGDLNGDGIADIAVGATGDDNVARVAGAIHILFMNADGSVKRTSQIDGTTENGPMLGIADLFGRSVANIGDLNGDGIADIAVGATGNAVVSTGTVYVINLDKNTVVRSVSSANPDGTYRTGDAIDITVRFSEPVDIAGSPHLLLETGFFDRMAVYMSGSGTETITFRYQIVAGDYSRDLEYVTASQLMLNGGSITASESPNQDAIPVLPTTDNFFEFTPVKAFGSLGLNKDLVVDGEIIVSDSVIPDDMVSGMGTASVSDSITPNDDTTISLSIFTSDSVLPDDVVGGMGSAFISDSVTPTDRTTAALSVSMLDSVAPDDVVGGMGSISVTDSVAPTDTVSGMGMVSESDSVAPTDRTTAALSVSILDSVAPDDAVGGMGSISVTDSVVPTDMVSGMGMISESDSVAPTDGTTAALSVSVSDSVVPSDTVGGMGSISVTDSVVPTDMVSGMGMVSESDSVVPTDRTTAALLISVSDSVVPDDVVGGMGSISVTDSVVPTDMVSGMGMISESDSVAPTDRTTAALSVSVSDSVVPSDTVGGMGSISVTDSVVSSDNADMMLSASLSALDSVVPTDSISGMESTAISAMDNIFLSDRTTLLLRTSISATDSITPADSIDGMSSNSETDSVVPSDGTDMLLSLLISASDSVAPSDVVDGMGSVLGSDSVTPSDQITRSLSISILASDSVTPADMTGAPPEPEPEPVLPLTPEPEQIRSSAPRTSSGGTGFALAPALMLYDRCDDKNDLVVIGATYGENLQATISSGGTYIAGNDITSSTNFANYIEHHNIPVNLHAFEFKGAPHAIDAITVHDDNSKEYTVPASFGNTCNGHTILYEPLSVMFKTHIEFGSRYGFVQSQDVGNVESVKPDMGLDVTTSDEEAIVSESVGTDSEPAEVDPEPLVSESVATDPEPTVVSESIGTDPEPEEVDPEPAPTQRPIWESVMEFFAGLIP